MNDEKEYLHYKIIQRFVNYFNIINQSVLDTNANIDKKNFYNYK